MPRHGHGDNERMCVCAFEYHENCVSRRRRHRRVMISSVSSTSLHFYFHSFVFRCFFFETWKRGILARRAGELENHCQPSVKKMQIATDLHKIEKQETNEKNNNNKTERPYVTTDDAVMVTVALHVIIRNAEPIRSGEQRKKSPSGTAHKRMQLRARNPFCSLRPDAGIQMSGKIIKLLGMQRKLRNQIISFTVYGWSSPSPPLPLPLKRSLRC